MSEMEKRPGLPDNAGEVKAGTSGKFKEKARDLGCLGLNDNKAGMEGLDKEKINQIIYEASKGSKFFENEKRKEQQQNLRITQQQTIIDKISASQLQQGLQQADLLLKDFEEKRDMSHTIVHVDMDAFYAAVEMRDNPALKDKPMAVGGLAMLSTSNYLARRYGVRAAMPGFIALRLCPELVIVPPNYEKYTSVSQQVREILAEYDSNFCPMSLDEAFLDLTFHLKQRFKSSVANRMFLQRAGEATLKTSDDTLVLCRCDLNQVLRPQIIQQQQAEWSYHNETCNSSLDFNALECDKHYLQLCTHCKKPFPHFSVKVYGTGVEDAVAEMRNRIEQKTWLTASAGIAPNTMLAKVCSDMKKPNGQFYIKPDKQEVRQFISALPIRKISGIGKVTEKLLNAVGVTTCSDIYKQRGLLYHIFSPVSFHYFMKIAFGIGPTTLERDGERKSMSTERSFSELFLPDQLVDKCQQLCHSLAADLKEEHLQGKTVTLKMKTINFEVKNRSYTLPQSTNNEKMIFITAKQLLTAEMEAVRPYPLRLRLMGVRMSKLMPEVRDQTSITCLLGKLQEASSIAYGQEDLRGDPTLHIQDAGDGQTLVGLEGEILTDRNTSCGQYKGESRRPRKSPRKFGSSEKNSTSPKLVCKQNKKQLQIDSYNFSVNTESQSNTSLTLSEHQDFDVGNEISCPVCGQCRQYWPLDQLNAHVDLCLNRQIIEDLISDPHCKPSSSVDLQIRNLKRPRQEEFKHQTHIKTKREKNQLTVTAFFKS